MDAYFSNEENFSYQSGKEKRILYVFTNPKADFTQIIAKYNDIKFLAIFSGEYDISENPGNPNNDVILYSTKTREFSKSFKGLKLTIENYVINKIRESMDKNIELGIIEGRKAIDEIFTLSKSIYTSYIIEDNTAIKKILSIIPKERIKSTLRYITAFIGSYYSMKLKIGANGAYLADVCSNEKDLIEKKEKVLETCSKKEALQKTNDQNSLNYSSANEYNGFDEIEYKSGEIEYKSDEIEYKSGEIEFESDEIEFESDEIEFESDEIEFESDEIEYNSGEIEFNPLNPILNESRSDLDQEIEELKISVKKFESEFIKIASADKNLYKCFSQLLLTYKKIIQSPYVYENPTHPEQIYVELRLNAWKREIPIDFVKKWFYLHLQKIMKLQKSGGNERDDIIFFEKELSWFYSILKGDIGSKIPIDLSDLDILKQKISDGAFNKQKKDNKDPEEIIKHKITDNNSNDSINISLEYISMCIKNDRIPDFNSFKENVTNLIKFVKNK